MQIMGSAVDYIKSVSSMFKISTQVLDAMAEPFSLWIYIYKDGLPVDLMLMGYNKAFQTLVNKQVEVGKSMGQMKPGILKYWLETVALVEIAGMDITVNDYVTSEGKCFSKALAFPIPLIGAKGIGIVFQGPKSETDRQRLCLKCRNNPTVQKPTLRMERLRIPSEIECSPCELCQAIHSLPSP